LHIVYLLITTTWEKQELHDILNDTLILKKKDQEQQFENSFHRIV